MSDKQLPFGGEIWKQNRFPYMVQYIITGDFGMGLSSDPRQIGNTAGHRCPDTNDCWDQETLAEHLHKLDYECEGQLYHLLLEAQYPGHLDEMRMMKGERAKEWTGK